MNMSIKMKEANELRKRWKEMGDKPCDHPSKEKEYHLGSATGDYVCTQCGKALFDNEWI